MPRFRGGSTDAYVAFSRDSLTSGTPYSGFSANNIGFARSTDNGATWSPPTVAYDSPLDDREGGLTVGPNGTLLLHVWSTFWKHEAYASLAPGSYPQDVIDRWIRHVDSPAYRAAEKQQGAHVLISRDSGVTWSKPLPGPDSVHGGITLHDGSLLTASYREEVKNVSLYAAPAPEGRSLRTADPPASGTPGARGPWLPGQPRSGPRASGLRLFGRLWPEPSHASQLAGGG